MSNYFGMVNTKNSNLYTNYAIESFFAHTDFSASSGDRFYLIDNDKSLLKIPKSAEEQVTIIKNEIPLSFAKNVNQILKIAIEDYADLVFLNNDIIFTPDWLSPLLKAEDKISMPSCNQYEIYKNKGLNLNVAMDLKDYIGHEKSFLEIVSWRNKQKIDVRFFTSHFLPFYCFRLPYSIASKVGFFDESFGKGGAEDVDYRLRANLSGFEVAIAMDSYVLHFMGKSTWRGAETQQEIEERNHIYIDAFRKKWGEKLTNIFLIPTNADTQIKKLSLDQQWIDKNYQSIIKKCL